MLIHDTSVVLAWLVKVSLVFPPHHFTQCNNSDLYACKLSEFSFRWCQSWWTPSFLKTAETSGLCQDRCLGSYFSMRKWVFKKFCQTHSSHAKIVEIIMSQRSQSPLSFLGTLPRYAHVRSGEQGVQVFYRWVPRAWVASFWWKILSDISPTFTPSLRSREYIINLFLIHLMLYLFQN